MTVPAMIWSIFSVTAIKANSAPMVTPASAPMSAASGKISPMGKSVLPR